MAESEEVIIVGAGGHGREVAHVLRSRRAVHPSTPRLVGFVDDAEVDVTLLEPFGPRLGTVAEGLAAHPGVAVIGGVADGRIRSLLVRGRRAAAPIIHPLADVGDDVVLGAGSVVCSHASLTTHVTVGVHVHVSRGAAIGHDAVLADFVSVMPLVAVSGNVRLGARVFVGTGAAIRQGVVVGDDAVIGMGAVVLHDVPAGATVIGAPARAMG